MNVSTLPVAGSMIGSFVDGSRFVVGVVVRRPEERDQLVDLAVVQRAGRVALSDQTGICELALPQT